MEGIGSGRKTEFGIDQVWDDRYLSEEVGGHSDIHWGLTRWQMDSKIRVCLGLFGRIRPSSGRTI